MNGNNSYERRKGKYMWLDNKFDMWCKEQAEELRKIGFNMNTRTVTSQLLDKVIIPNNISLKDLVKPKLKIRGKKWIKKQTY
jgi:hypothetical protein